MSQDTLRTETKIGVWGLGYVGLPLAHALAQHFPTVGYDINAQRVEEILQGIDHNLALSADDLKLHSKITYTAEADVVKVASGSTEATADKVDALYKTIITAGTHRAGSIKVAEAAKVIENTQRDLNIALVNELTILFEKLDIDTHEVLRAAASKWNSLENPQVYVSSNLVGFVNVLDACRYNEVEHLVYASSSSVYGANTHMPFSVHSNVDHPLSLYAASKKANELMAHTYSHLFDLPTTGLRFFTVYGPWGCPDMALFKFTRAILAGEAIDVYNFGKHQRDFTYIDDIVEGVIRTLDKIATSNADWDSDAPDPATSKAPYRLYNIGSNRPIELMSYIEILEQCLGKTAEKNLLPLQAGDVPATYAVD